MTDSFAKSISAAAIRDNHLQKSNYFGVENYPH